MFQNILQSRSDPRLDFRVREFHAVFFSVLQARREDEGVVEKLSLLLDLVIAYRVSDDLRF